MQTYGNNGEQKQTRRPKLLTTNFEVKVKNRKVEGPHKPINLFN